MRVAIIILLIFPLQTFSQNTFLKEFSTSLKDIGKEIHVIDDSTFILECARIDEYNIHGESTYLYMINLDGDIINQNSLPINLNKIFPVSTGGYVFSGNSFDGKLVIGLLTDSLTIDSIVTHSFGNKEYVSVDAVRTDSNFFIASGTIIEGNIKQTVLHKFEQNLDTVKFLLLDIMDSGPYALIEESYRMMHRNDSSIYLIGSNAFIVKLNSNLDTLISFRNENFSIPSIINYDICFKEDTLLVLSDGIMGLGYVISKVTEDLVFESFFHNNLYPYWESMFYSMVNVNDNYFLAGHLKIGSDNLQRQIGLININEKFDTVWIRKFGGQFNENAYDITLTSDSSLMIIGETQTATYNNAVDVILIKTDLNGHVIGGTGFIPDRKVMVNVYPNPTPDLLSIDFVNENSLQGLSFQLYDISGKQILTKELKDSHNNYQIDLSSVMPGVYVYRLADDQGVFLSDKILIR